MEKFEEYKRQYFQILEKFEAAIESGRWEGMSLEIDRTNFERGSSVKIHREDFCLYFSFWGSRIFPEEYSPLDESGEELFNILTDGMDVIAIRTPEDGERALFAYIDAEYQSKRYLTGKDYEHYELNPDLEVDEYGVIYNNRSKTIVKCLNENLETYWVKDGTKRINNSVFANHEHLSTIVLPETISYIHSDVLLGCKKLQKVVLLGQTHWDGWPVAGCKLYLQNYDLDFYYRSNTLIFDKEKIKQGIIAAANSGFTYRDLLAYLQGMSDDELGEPVSILTPDNWMDGLVGIHTRDDKPQKESLFSRIFKEHRKAYLENCKYKIEHERIKRDSLPHTYFEIKQHFKLC